MSVAAVAEYGFEVTDVTGQKVMGVSNIPESTTVTELNGGLLSPMRLPANDSAGRPLSYHARLEREGRHLQGAERVRESVRTGDRVVLQPNIDAGGAHRDRVVI
jgi:hypothetical protein